MLHERPPIPPPGYQYTREDMLVMGWAAIAVLNLFGLLALGALLGQLF